MKIYKLQSNCGEYQKPKGHLDTQMFPECVNTPADRDVVKKNRKRKEKAKKEASIHHCMKNTCPFCGNVETCRCSTPKTIQTNDLCHLCKEASERSGKKRVQAQASQAYVSPDVNRRISDIKEGWISLSQFRSQGVITREQYSHQVNLLKKAVETLLAEGVDRNYPPLRELIKTLENNAALSFASGNNAKVIAKKKKKEEDWDYNPWAVCTESIGKTEDTTERSEWSEEAKKRYERCIKKLKKNRND